MDLSRAVRSLRLVVVPAVIAALVAFPLGVLASHSFADVPTNHPFHADIAAVKDSGVSPTGCGGGNFCPEDFVTRGQMAAFLNRIGALGPGKVPVTNADKLDGIDSSGFLPAADYTVMQVGPWHATGSSAVTIQYFPTANTVASASSGERFVQVALDGPASVGGIGYGFASVRICYGTMSSSGTIDATIVWQQSVADPLARDDTDRPTALVSPACYTVTDDTPTIAAGATTLQLDLAYAGAGTTYVWSVTTTWTPVSS